MHEATPIRVLIVDDEPLARTRIRQLLDQLAPDFAVIGEADSGHEAILATQALQPEAIFLDIQMADLDGFEVLAALEADESACSTRAVVFVTAYDRFAVRAFEINAVDYVLKPIDEDRFGATVHRVHERLRPPDPAVSNPSSSRSTLTQLMAELPSGRYLRRCVVPERGRLVFVPVSAIECLIAADNYVKVCTFDRVHLLRIPLSVLLKRIDPAEFLQVHRSHVVSMSHIQELIARSHGEYDVRLASGRAVRSSRAYQAAIRTRLITEIRSRAG